jgi:hypothetical protein
MIQVACGACGETYRADDGHVGRFIRCRCGELLQVLAPVPARSKSSFFSRRPAVEVVGASTPARRKSGRFLGYCFVASLFGWFLWWIVGGWFLLGVPVSRPAVQSENERSGSSAQQVSSPRHTTPTCGGAAVRPESGATVGGKQYGGLGTLKIENGTDDDALALLVDERGIVGRAVYVRSGQTDVIGSVPVGTYRLRFQLGKEWLASRRFCQVSASSEFNDPFEFRESPSEHATEYSAFEVTFHPVFGGTARTHSISSVDLTVPE